MNKPVEKQITDLNRVLNSLNKCKSLGSIIDCLLQYGTVNVSNGFNGISIYVKVHSRVLQNGIKSTFILCQYAEIKNEAKNQIHPVLIELIAQTKIKIEKRIEHLTLILKKQNENE